MVERPGEGVVYSSDFSNIAGAHLARRKRERERAGARRALNKNTRATWTMAAKNGAVSPDGEVGRRKRGNERSGQVRSDQGRVRAVTGNREGEGH